jgi:hypothetical protein
MEGLLGRRLCRPFDQASHLIRLGDIHRVAARNFDCFAAGMLGHAALEIGIDVAVVGVFAIILGVAVCIEYPPRLALAIFIIGVGNAFLCSGGVTLWNYLRTAPPSAYET